MFLFHYFLLKHNHVVRTGSESCLIIFIAYIYRNHSAVDNT